MKTAVGIDIGGTKISMVIGNSQGRILAENRIPTLAGAKAKEGIASLIQNLKNLIASSGIPKKQILGIGVGIPGPVNPKTGIVPVSPHLGGWQGTSLKKIIERETKLRVTMNNDANAAALGEKIFGQGRGVSDFIYMTVSTGIGGGIVIDGKLLNGTSHVAGEVGHMTIVPNGERCKCGKLGCLEAYASGTAIARFAAQELKRHGLSKMMTMMTQGRPLTAQVVGQCALKGDPLAIRLYELTGFYLGVGIANLLNILNPQKIILGGGVFKSAPKHFWKAMLASCKQAAWPDAFRAVKIVPSKLRGRVGDLGALALVFNEG